MSVAGPLIFGAVLTLALIIANERIHILRSDHFASPVLKWIAYAWVGLYTCGIAYLVTDAGMRRSAQPKLEEVPFWSIFSMHILLMIFLGVWWLLASRPRIVDFLNLRTENLDRSLLIGMAVGVGGWAVTLALAFVLGWLLSLFNLVPEDLKPSPMIPWMASLPIWKKAMIVFTAMTVEEFFFRGFLQKRFGLIISTILFALAHVGYGQPIMLFGITIVSLIIGYTFYKTRSLWPCIIAHGVFDAIQLFVIVPLVVKFSGMAVLFGN